MVAFKFTWKPVHYNSICSNRIETCEFSRTALGKSHLTQGKKFQSYTLFAITYEVFKIVLVQYYPSTLPLPCRSSLAGKFLSLQELGHENICMYVCLSVSQPVCLFCPGCLVLSVGQSVWLLRSIFVIFCCRQIVSADAALLATILEIQDLSHRMFFNSLTCHANKLLDKVLVRYNVENKRYRKQIPVFMKKKCNFIQVRLQV